ncbi:MAG: radical SAM protein, partial [Selenomonas sp.]|nr:radical SAM protein [Selenomonas sp.]
MTAVCDLCPHACRLREDETGFCRARTNVGGVIRPPNYG